MLLLEPCFHDFDEIGCQTCWVSPLQSHLLSDSYVTVPLQAFNLQMEQSSAGVSYSALLAPPPIWLCRGGSDAVTHTLEEEAQALLQRVAAVRQAPPTAIPVASQLQPGYLSRPISSWRLDAGHDSWQAYSAADPGAEAAQLSLQQQQSQPMSMLFEQPQLENRGGQASTRLNSMDRMEVRQLPEGRGSQLSVPGSLQLPPSAPGVQLLLPSAPTTAEQHREHSELECQVRHELGADFIQHSHLEYMTKAN